jgi:hypothetical protein
LAPWENAESIDSPVLVTRTEPSPTLLRRCCGGDEELAFSLFQGPGESPDMSGLGSGVISPIAEMIGLGTKLLVPLAEPRLLVRAALRLGVLERGCKLLDEARWFNVNEPRDEPMPFPLLKDSRRSGVVGRGGKSVEILREPTGLIERLGIAGDPRLSVLDCGGGSSPSCMEAGAIVSARKWASGGVVTETSGSVKDDKGLVDNVA